MMYMELMRRKLDAYLKKWKEDKNRLPLIVKGARQIGKTASIMQFAKANYSCVIDINFVLQSQYRQIFDNGYEVDEIIKNITLLMPYVDVIEYDTLIFFDEMQVCPACATALKSFKLDGRYDVICSGSLMGINYQEIESNSVGYKEDYMMYSMDFEEFLWAKGFKESQIEDLYQHMLHQTPLSELEMKRYMDVFFDYMVVGGMPAVVKRYIDNNHFSGVLKMQQQLLLDYEEDITKYAQGLDKGRILNVYRSIPVFLGKDNKKFQITKVERNARSANYVGTIDWLNNAGMIHTCYCLEQCALPLKGNYKPSHYKIYYGDSGLLVASLDEEAQMDLRLNRNFNTYKGAIYENVVAESLVKQGYKLYFYTDGKSQLEMDFFVRDMQSLIPVEVKARDGATASLNNLIKKEKYDDIKYGIKFGYKNIGFNGFFYTFPYFMVFLLKRFLHDKSVIKQDKSC